MKTLNHAIAAFLVVVCIASCKTVPQHTDVYESNLQVLAMPSCTAKLEEFCTCFAILTDSEGRKFYIGSPGASEDVEHFIASLKQGEIYYLPAAFEGFLAKKKTAAEK